MIMISNQRLTKQQCRTCYTSTQNLQYLKSYPEESSPNQQPQTQKNYAQLLTEVCNINTLEDLPPDQWPQFICSSCSEKLKSAYDFIQQTHKVNKLLKSIIKKPHIGNHNDYLIKPELDIPLDIKEEQEDNMPVMENNEHDFIYRPMEIEEIKSEIIIPTDTDENSETETLQMEDEYFFIPKNSSATREKDQLNELLKKWNLEHLLDFLIFEKITITVLKFMEQHHIPLLFKNQKMGDMILFEYHLKEWKKSHSVIISHKTAEISNSISQCSSKSTSTPSPSETNISDVTLSVILNENRKSLTLTKYYNENSKLLCHHRNLLVNIISQYFEDKNIHMSLATSYKLEEEILNRFPTEKLQYYRTSKRGKIYMKYCNSKMARNPIKRKATEVSEQPGTSSKDKVLCPESNAEDCVKRLKCDNLNTQEFDNCWQECSHYRINDIKQSTSLTEIFEKWPEYLKPNGFRFIDKDFGVAFGNRQGVLHNWPKHFMKIKNFLQTENNVKDKTLREILNNLDDSLSNNDIAAAKLMWCLHGYFIPLLSVIKDNNNKTSYVKYTIKNSQDAFMFVGNSEQEIHDHICKVSSKPDCVQPFILALGTKDMKSLETFFVYLNGISLKFSSFLSALDICFKCFYLFNLKYPPACIQFWQFIETYFYKFKNTNHKISSRVYIITEQLNEQTINNEN